MHTLCQQLADWLTSLKVINAPSVCVLSRLQIGRFLFFVLSIFFYITPNIGHTETIISGSVSGVWTQNGSPYIIVDGANVLQNQILTINPGVEVIFRAEFNIEGNIQAVGNQDDSIVFRTDVQNNRFDFLVFNHQTGVRDSSSFIYCKMFSQMRYFYIRVWLDAPELKLFFSNTTIDSGYGVYFETGRSLTCVDCRFKTKIETRSINHIRITGNTFQHLPGATECLITFAEDVVLNNNFFMQDADVAIQVAREVEIIGNDCPRPEEGMRFTPGENSVGGISSDSMRDGVVSGNLNTVFRNNHAWWSWIFVGDGNLLVENDTIYHGGITGRGYMTGVIRHCQAPGIGVSPERNDSSSFLVEENTLNGGSGGLSCGGTSFRPVFRNNKVNNEAALYIVNGALPEVYNNGPFGSAQIQQAGGNIHHNTFFYNGSNAAVDLDNAFDLTFSNNVVITENYEGVAIGLEECRRVDVFNNIVYHRLEPEQCGIYSRRSDSCSIRYNCIYNYEREYFSQDSIDTHDNFNWDPLFANLEANSFRLRPGSPAIDAGDPDAPNDPDNTRADIGAFFFRQDRNQPPMITSSAYLLVGKGDTLHYIATAVDAESIPRITVSGLPEWLEANEIGDGDSLEIVGRAPREADELTLWLIAQDNDDIRDSTALHLTVSEYSLLSSNITGRLSIDDSPYWILENAIVPAGDSLVIEPGVRVRFKMPMPSRSLYLPNLTIEGRLECVGTAEDSIYFWCETERNATSIEFLHSPDSSEMAYITYPYGSDPLISFYLIGSYLWLHNSNLGYEGLPTFGLELSYIDSSNVIVESCLFNVERGSRTARSSNIVFRDNYFIADKTIRAHSRNNCWRFISCNVSSTHNYFRDFNGAYAMVRGGILHSDYDTFIDCRRGFYLDSDSAFIEHCFIDSLRIKTSRIDSTRFASFDSLDGYVSLRNSIILNTESSMLTHPQGGLVLQISNNLFFKSDSATSSLLDGFGIVSTVNDNGDSTDAYGNLFGDPQLIGLYPIENRLLRGSRCIDAASAVDDERDTDGSLPDLGPVSFDHRNHPLELSEIQGVPADSIILGDTLHLNIDVQDPDEDVFTFRWTVNILDRDSLANISHSASALFVPDSVGEFQVVCIASDGYDLDTAQAHFSVKSRPIESITDRNSLPLEFRLYSNYPNPFNESTVITFDLPNSDRVRLKAYDLRGRQIDNLIDTELHSGQYTITWKPQGLPSGLYIIRLSARNKASVIKTIFIK